MTTGGERFGIRPADMAEAAAEGRPPRKNLVRDTSEPAELRDGLDLPVLSGYGARPNLAAKLRSFVSWLAETY
jgi:hypothetical protein